MKNLLLITTIILLSFSNGIAQDKKIYLGIKGGVNIASFTNLKNSNSQSYGSYEESFTHPARVLPHFGVYSEIKFNDFVSFQPELLFSMKGYRLKSISRQPNYSLGFTEKFSLAYFDIPLQLKVNTGKGFCITAGPSLSILLNAQYKAKFTETYNGESQTDEIDTKVNDDISTIDIGMFLGMGYQLKNGLNFGIRWNRGFSDIFKSHQLNHQNSVLQISTGFAF